MAETQMPGNFRAIAELDEGWKNLHPGQRVEEMRERGRAFHSRFKKDGPARAIHTVNLAPFPYPVAFGFWQAAPNKAKFLMMRNRMNIIEFEDFEGSTRTLLANPTEHDLSAKAPFFANVLKKAMPIEPARKFMLEQSDPPGKKLAELGIDPAKVDYITFDHLHVQDLRRALVGENGRPPLYPNAKLIVNRREIETLENLHPLQRPWWIEGALDGVADEKIIALEGSAWLGKGLAIVWTPGHTLGNHSIFFHAAGRGVFGVSENGICPDSYIPQASKLSSLREYSQTYGAEVVMNGNTVESTFAQYSSMIMEKEIVDKGDVGGEVPNMYNSSPFFRSPLAWGIAPTFSIKPVITGTLSHARR